MSNNDDKIIWVYWILSKQNGFEEVYPDGISYQ